MLSAGWSLLHPKCASIPEALLGWSASGIGHQSPRPVDRFYRHHRLPFCKERRSDFSATTEATTCRQMALLVPDPPTLTGPETPLRVGQELVLKCVYTPGYPIAQLSWYNGTDLITNINFVEGIGLSLGPNGERIEESTIYFRNNVTKYDNGVNVTCRVSQSEGGITIEKETWKILTVHYPPTVVVPREQVRVFKGKTAAITCQVDSNPTAVITWIKLGDNTTVLQGNLANRNQTLVIPRASQRDEGTYQCSAENDLPPKAVGTVQFFVDVKPYDTYTRDVAIITISVVAAVILAAIVVVSIIMVKKKG
ncbi:putative oxidoreductase PXDNL [Branchiostoma floridae x Branchiostoma japonicum]